MFAAKGGGFSTKSFAANFPILIYMLYSQTIMKATFR